MRIKFNKQTENQLSKDLGAKCTIAGNGWENVRHITIKGKTFKVNVGEEIPLDVVKGDESNTESNALAVSTKTKEITEEIKQENTKAYIDYTVVELKKMCKDRGIEKYSRLSEAALIELLESNDKNKEV